jgi:hypothetical protein
MAGKWWFCQIACINTLLLREITNWILRNTIHGLYYYWIQWLYNLEIFCVKELGEKWRKWSTVENNLKSLFPRIVPVG